MPRRKPSPIHLAAKLGEGQRSKSCAYSPSPRSQWAPVSNCRERTRPSTTCHPTNSSAVEVTVGFQPVYLHSSQSSSEEVTLYRKGPPSPCGRPSRVG